MATITIFGASDDLIEIDGVPGADEFCKPAGAWVGVIEAPNGDTALVFVDYRDNGCWTTALGLFDEDYKFPNWKITTSNCDELGTAYSTFTTIEVPDGTTIREWEF